MSGLDFKEDDQGNETKFALKMFAKDGEAVELAHECDCNGQVRRHEIFYLIEQRSKIHDCFK